ncbi:MAG: peptide chain release factor N(5)-glutamine methyltransferase [bacterium]
MTLEQARKYLQLNLIAVSANVTTEADYIISKICQIPSHHLLMYPNQPLTQLQKKCLQNICNKRKNNMPLAYIFQEKEFFGINFYINNNVLIPRPETEILVETCINFLKQFPDKKLLMCDFGTGSGCIPLSIILNTKNVSGTLAIDISSKAISVAKQNANTLLSPKQQTIINWKTSDIFSNLGSLQKFDLITSNPPYIPAKQIPALEPSVRNFEPVGALDGGKDGLIFYKRIAELILQNLSKSGMAILEINPILIDDLTEIFQSFQYKFIPDLTGKKRFIQIFQNF